MAEGIVVATVHCPSTVYGVHGTEGLSRWACLSRRAGMAGDWEAVEWAALPPGGISGAHLHSRTEELYLILSGRGEITLNGRAYEVAPGHLIATGLGTRHGLRNTGDGDLTWLVVEVSVRREGEARMGTFTLVNLREAGEIDTSAVLTGPLRVVKLADLAPGEQTTIEAGDAEHSLFVLRGSARAQCGDLDVSLAEGTAVTLPLGSRLLLTANRDGVEFFQATLAVDADVTS